MTPLEWIAIVTTGAGLVTYVGDSFIVFIRDIKEALADGRLDAKELTKIENNSRLVVKGVLKFISLFRSI